MIILKQWGGTKCAFKIFLGITPSQSHIGKKMVMFGEYQSIMIFYEGSLKMAHCKKIKLSFRIHAQLINMDLQESMIINDI
jgi:hypothetical protein